MRSVAQMRNWVAIEDFMRYPKEIIISRLENCAE